MKIAIVNDLPLAVEALRRVLALKPEHELIWVARDGAEAVALCAQQTPDLVLMDLLMPVMDGVEATRRIMAATPCAILVVTVSVGANSWRVFEAMGHGALDAVDTPSLGGGDPAQSAAALLTKIDTIGRMIGSPHSSARAGRPAATAGTVVGAQALLAIGASAGGPSALATLLGGLPKDFPAAVIIVQHVDREFAAGMAEWLGRESPLPVRVAKADDIPCPGQVLLAGTNDHLLLRRNGRLAYDPEPLSQVYRPSVDVFFHSVVQHWPGRAVGVLLTGMGRDGAQGLKALRDHGCHTIAQDRASSAVYGMPKAAAAIGAAIEILPLARIAERLAQLFAGGAGAVNGVRP